LSPKLELFIAQRIKRKSDRSQLSFRPQPEKFAPEVNFIKLTDGKIGPIDCNLRQAGYQSQTTPYLFRLLPAFFQFIQQPTALSFEQPECQAISAGVNGEGNLKLNTRF